MASKIKFQCHIIQKNPGDFDVLLKPAEGDHPEHADVFTNTPCGFMRLDNVTAEIASQFEVGKIYFVEFVPAD